MLPDLQACLDRIRFQEQPIDFLEAEVGGFGVGEIDQRYKRDVEAHKDQVGLPLEIGDDGRSNHNHKEVPYRLRQPSHGLETKGVDQLTQLLDTPTAVPLARTCSGRISGT